MTDFLLELLSEEIPARMQAKAREDLARLFTDEIGRAGLKAEALETYSTPRRLVLIARGLPLATESVSEEVKGPRASAPPQALEGFLRKTGLTREQLTERDGVLFAVTERPGRLTGEVLAEAIPAIVRAFPWPKSMRWGAASIEAGSPRWVRPLRGIVALLGEEIVPCEVAGVTSGATTLGHRFHHPGIITIGSAEDYAAKLRACHVIVDHREREAIVREGAKAAAEQAGLMLVEDEGLVVENAGLTEWPVPLLGRFDPDFLRVPPEVIQLTARVNQKYFVCRDGVGALANAFVCTANIDAADGGAMIVEGNRKVLAARLSDARFFYETDLKVPLAKQAEKLSQIVFHERLGTVADKVDRVAKLARWLIEEGIVRPTATTSPQTVIPAQAGIHNPEPAEPMDSRLRGNDEQVARLAQMADDAAKLCKADLVTGMVGEFPELQGIMGGYYARAEGLADEVADAIRDHYKPVGQGDEVPTAPVTVAVSLADKLDTISAFFYEDMPPTGTRDPFALRRAALGSLTILARNAIRLQLSRAVLRVLASLSGLQVGRVQRERVEALISARRELGETLTDDDIGAIHTQAISEVANEDVGRKLLEQYAMPAAIGVVNFFADRLKVQQREAGVRHDLIDAVFALGGEDDLVRLLARVRALQAFVATEDGANLLAGYKRAANILRIEEKKDAATPGLTSNHQMGYEPLPEEAALITALDTAEPAATAAVEREDFEGAMRALAGLRAPIDAFFDKVTVNDADPAKRAARLALLARIRDAVHTVADFSRIEG